MTVDASGNVYVTATSWSIAENLSDYVTVKYDTDGKEIWTKRYNDPYNASDAPTAIAVDLSGNVYVTGAAYNVGGSRDYTTIKYDAAGNELWLRHYGFAPDRNDYPVAIVLDVSGNIYITGSSDGESYSTDFATVKYDAAGNELWSQRYGSSYGSDDAHALAVDAMGNVYVTGGSGSDCTTIKYDASGNELWVKKYNGTGNGNDFAVSVAIDAAGNVYVTGSSYSGLTPNDWDYTTIKYDAVGNELWVRKHNGRANDSDAGRVVTVDPFGNVYVTGNSDNGENGWDYEALGWDYATIKYDRDGNELWVREYNGPGNSNDDPRAIALDPLGNVYVTGSSIGNTSNRDFATIKYDREGNEVWVIRYNGPNNVPDGLPRLALDAAGNVYVGGYSFGNNGEEYAVVKYVQSAPLIVNAGADKTLYLGYDPACVSLSVTVSGGNAPYSYSWSAQNGNTSDISVCPGATTTYSITVTDATGRQVKDEVTINVIDVRCGNNKIVVCHKGKNTLCISAGAVADHLNHGDKLGRCANERTTVDSRLAVVTKTGEGNLTGTNKLKVYVAPNPIQHGTRIYYELVSDGEVVIRILDAVGRVVSNLEKAHRKAGSYNKEWNTNSLGKGVYYYQVYFTAKGETTVETGKLLVVK